MTKKKSVFLLVVAGGIIGPMTFDLAGYYEDQQLKSYETPACVAFNQVEVPESSLLPRRYKHEDSERFHRLRANCEESVQ